MEHRDDSSPQVSPPTAALEKWPLPSSSVEEVTTGALFFLATAIAIALLISMVGCVAQTPPSQIVATVERIVADDVITPEEKRELINLVGDQSPVWLQTVGALVASVVAAFTGMKWGKSAAVRELGPQIAAAHKRLDAAESP